MSVQRIAFRTDATSQIGTGHFMRCLTLAEALKHRGADICFISRDLPPHLGDMLVAKGIDYVPLVKEEAALSCTEDLAHSHWLGTTQARDAETTIRVLSDHAWDWIIVDHYALDARWESALRSITKKILVIDDIADRQHDCDVLLDQNFYADMNTRYADKVPAHCELLMGPSYALLRDEFRKLHEHVKPRTGKVKNILVFFGGVDINNYTGHAIEALSGIGISGLHVDVVIGTQHPCLEQIKITCAQQGFNCYVQTTKMAELMAEADLAIGAGGSACWERCCLGLPGLLVSLADNQIDIARALDSFGACIYVGTFKTVSPQFMMRAVVNILNSQEQLEKLSGKAYSLVDGLGVERVCEAMSC